MTVADVNARRRSGASIRLRATALVTRERQYRNAVNRWTVAWKWLYSVNGIAIGTRLDEARAYARRHFPGCQIIEAWGRESGVSR